MRRYRLTRYTILQSLKSLSAVIFESNEVTDSSRASLTFFINYMFSYQEPDQTSFNTMQRLHYAASVIAAVAVGVAVSSLTVERASK